MWSIPVSHLLLPGADYPGHPGWLGAGLDWINLLTGEGTSRAGASSGEWGTCAAALGPLCLATARSYLTTSPVPEIGTMLNTTLGLPLPPSLLLLDMLVSLHSWREYTVTDACASRVRGGAEGGEKGPRHAPHASHNPHFHSPCNTQPAGGRPPRG